MVLVGIDIGKSKHDYAIVDGSGGVLKTGEFSSTRSGFEKLEKVLSGFEIELIGMEATGHYWRNLCKRGQGLIRGFINIYYNQNMLNNSYKTIL